MDVGMSPPILSQGTIRARIKAVCRNGMRPARALLLLTWQLKHLSLCLQETSWCTKGGTALLL